MTQAQLLPCPFCGRKPSTATRRESPIEGRGYVAIVGCYCGGYSANANLFAVAATVNDAVREVSQLWNTRSTPWRQIDDSLDERETYVVWDVAGWIPARLCKGQWVEASCEYNIPMHPQPTHYLPIAPFEEPRP